MDRKKGDVKYQTTQTGETGKAELFRIYLAECRGPFGLFFFYISQKFHNYPIVILIEKEYNT